MIEGSSANAIFDCSGGKLIPGKHLLLCLIVKSLTGSKTIVSFNLFQCGLREHRDPSPQQLTCYMKHIQLHPARADVIKEALSTHK